ncbi:MAG: MBL fold metallo-hydrolase [Thermoanaerobaculales bacterium]
MEVLILASGSSGNAALISSGNTSVLVDAGVSAIQLRRRLEAFGRSPDDVDAVLLTHEHSDHVRGLDVFLRRHHGAPVWATNGTWSRMDLRSNGGGELLSGRELRLGCLRITPVATSHDAAEPVALLVDDGCHRAALCTDTGIFTALLERRLATCDLLFLEANHDKDMLRHGPYPWPLKQRIDSRLGHLSNHQSEEAVARLRSSVLRAVVGLHLSAENNCPQMVQATLREAVGDELPVTAVTRRSMLRVTISSEGACLEPHDLPPRRGQ